MSNEPTIPTPASPRPRRPPDEIRLTPVQAYKAMQLFLEEYRSGAPSDAMDMILSDLELLDDGNSADPAMIRIWDRCVKGAMS